MNGLRNIDIAVTGRTWLGKGVGSIWTMIEDSISAANDEMLVTAYSISENSMELIDLTEKALLKGIRVTLIVNRFDNQSYAVKEKLRRLNNRFREFILKDFSPESTSEDLHAKLIVIDHSVALIGSANLTWKGMVVNHELMVRIKGIHACEIGNLVDRLLASDDAKTIEKRSW